MQALAVTVTQFVLEPLEHIGSAIGRLIGNTLQDLPLQLWPFAQAFVGFVTFLLLTMACGYKTNIFYMFGMEPGETRHSRRHIEAQMKDRSEELTHHVRTGDGHEGGDMEFLPQQHSTPIIKSNRSDVAGGGPTKAPMEEEPVKAPMEGETGRKVLRKTLVRVDCS